MKNICFDSTRHEWLLHELKVLPYLLLPLAGPEEFSDEDNDMFPTELQVKNKDKFYKSKWFAKGTSDIYGSNSQPNPYMSIRLGGQ